MRTRSLLICATLAPVMSVCWAQEAKQDPRPSPDGVIADELVGPGYRRVYRTDRVALSAAEAAELLAAGKHPLVDSQSGEMLLPTFTDHLPADWLVGQVAGPRTDSFGLPIVNEVPGLPAWSDRDVQSLRDAVREWLGRAGNGGELDAAEAEFVLGNYLGQAIVRGIDLSDLVNLNDRAAVRPGVVASIVDTMRFCENQKWLHQDAEGYAYTPSVYGPGVAALLTANGFSLVRDVLTIDGVEQGDGLRGVGGTCYDRQAFGRGIVLLAGQTDIWNGGNIDDASADVAIGWDTHHHYSCQDEDNLSTVRVSTNGYISFFQQGGGALVGAEFVNNAIPSATDPDGFVAGWWDDLIINSSQGTTDRVSHKVEGAFGDRVFTVEWFSVSRLGGLSTDFHFFQIKLFENSDTVELHYGLDVSGWLPDTSDNATVGMENYDGSDGDCGPNCGNTNSTPPPNDYRFNPFRPFNDICGDAGTIHSGQTIESDLTDASNDGAASCGSSDPNRDLWYRFNASCDGTLTVRTCGSRDLGGADLGPDTVVSIHSGCPGTTGNELACNDDSNGGCGAGGHALDSIATLAMTPGQSVLIRVSHFGSGAFRLGNGRVSVSAQFDSPPASAPANDSCGGAQTLFGLSGTDFGSVSCATNDGQSDCGISEFNNDVWYRFVAPCDGTLTVDTCGTNDGPGVDQGMDTVLSLHSACPGTLGNQLQCNDDTFVTCDGSAGNGYDSHIDQAMTAGDVVFVRVSHYLDGIADGNFVLNHSFARSGGAPFNDDCANAENLFGIAGSSIGSVGCATSDGTGAGGCGASAGNPDVWYSYTASCNGTLEVDTCGTHDAPGVDLGMDTVLTLHSGCPGTGSNELTCNDDASCTGAAGNGFDSRVSHAMTAGQNVRIRVSHFGSTIQDGLFMLQYRFTPSAPPVNDGCGGAINIGEGSFLGTTVCADNTGPAGCFSEASPDVFYRYTPNCTGFAHADTCQAPTNYDTVLSAHTACPPSALNEITCDDDSSCGLPSRIDFPVTAGVPVFIRVSGFIGSFGNFRLNVTCEPTCPCDWNHADGLDSQDYFDFLEGFFAGDADFNGVDGTDSQDYFDFLECFFAPPPGCQ